MSKPIDLAIIRAERREFCPYCTKPAHMFPTACPRVRRVWYYDPDEWGNQAVESIALWPTGLEEEDGSDDAA